MLMASPLFYVLNSLLGKRKLKMGISHFTFFHFLLLLLLCISVNNNVLRVNGDCQLAVRGGGCPEVKQCVETCRPCYRGIGKITPFCRPAGGGIPFDECICYFSHGAPCDPPAPPQCPGRPVNWTLV